MKAGELCNRDVVFVYRDTRLVEAARLMREHHVGSLVVVVERLSERVPVAILTDRDIVVAVVAKELDPRTLTVADVLTDGLVTVREQDDVSDALRVMREAGIRRVPVLSRSGALAGILALDDVLELMAEEMNDFARTMVKERVRETRLRR